MKTVYQTANIGEMTIIKSILESSGIKCFLLDEYNPLVRQFTLQFFGLSRLTVPDDQEKEAREIIADYLKTLNAEAPEAKEALRTPLKCPECGSEEFAPTLLSIIFGGSKYKCSACRKNFSL